jgi:predicted XRE-type DNA-binding protein
MRVGMQRTSKTNGARTRTPKVEAGSGNVFRDLDLPEPEEDLARAQLAQRICRLIAERHLTQAKAASLLGVDQPKVSALMRGRLAGFSTDRLFRFLNALGSDVEITIRSARRGRSVGGVKVVPFAG